MPQAMNQMFPPQSRPRYSISPALPGMRPAESRFSLGTGKDAVFQCHQDDDSEIAAVQDPIEPDLKQMLHIVIPGEVEESLRDRPMNSR